MERRTIETGGVKIPVIELDALVIGSGAAALKCADRLAAFGVERTAVVTERLGGGTSNNSGSDKQTYYKLGLGSQASDSPYDMAQDLFRGGSMHGDIALVEALGSAEAFHHLVSIGVPFPKNRYGGYVGYKTDHDPRSRATSAGPYTSMQMVAALLGEVKRRGVRIFDRHEVVALVAGGGRAMGALALDRAAYDAAISGAARAVIAADAFARSLVLFMAENTVFATGGPGGIYERSVYPEDHTGAIGLALEIGAEAVNLTESQFGLASIKFRWNVSGTYQQVIPRYFSTDAEGRDEREFLNEYFPDMRSLTTAIFLKGYQWPFDPRKVERYGSSLIDVLVYRETAERGRRVFMDFRENPRGDERLGAFSTDALGEEASAYLGSSGALFGTPIERLRKMNPMSIELYRRHGIDLESEPLEIGVCAQHNNGGLAADVWWESVNVRRLFPIGEVNGSHGVYRPGGSALNSGQVGALRAAERIANLYADRTLRFREFENPARTTVERLVGLVLGMVSPEGDDGSVREERAALRHAMTLHGAHIRNPATIREAEKEAYRLTDAFDSVRIVNPALVPERLVTRHLLLAHAAYLSAVRFYLESGGGSRGSYLVLDAGGVPIHERLPSHWRFKPEVPAFAETLLSTRLTPDGRFTHELVPRRPIPTEEFWFENVWNEFLKKDIFR